MIEIRRAFNPDTGLGDVEQLRGYVFSSESFAHRFVIERTDGYGFEGYASAQFLRADGVKVRIADTETAFIDSDGNAAITLTPECYEVPGRFLLTIWHTVGSEKAVIYAAESTVLDTESADEVLSTRTVRTIESQVNDALGAAWSAAIFARNIGEIEDKQDEILEAYAGLDEALAQQGVWAMRPNLLNKDAWWVQNSSNVNVVCGDAARWSKSGGAYMKSITGYRIYTTEPTQEQTAGATYVYHREADANADPPITEAWYVYRDADDGIVTSCVALTGDNIVTDGDGETYDKALQYAITANTAWGNMETLYYPSGASSLYYKQGETFKSYGYIVDDMQVGEVYTVSCWARITSGTEAWLKFGWGGIYQNSMGYPADKSGVSDVISVTGSEWHRIGWTFTFNPTGAEYTETTETVTPESGDPYTRVKRSFNWYKRVMIGVHRKFTATLQLCGFRLTKGGLYGSDTVDTLKENIRTLTARVAALEALALENE